MTNYRILLLVSTIAFLSYTDINAQQLEVSPGTLSFATNPGSSQTQQINLRNKGNTEQSYIFNLSDWLTDENGEVKYFTPGTIPRSCADWITVSPALVTLQPNEQQPSTLRCWSRMIILLQNGPYCLFNLPLSKRE